MIGFSVLARLKKKYHKTHNLDEDRAVQPLTDSLNVKRNLFSSNQLLNITINMTLHGHVGSFQCCDLLWPASIRVDGVTNQHTSMPN